MKKYLFLAVLTLVTLPHTVNARRSDRSRSNNTMKLRKKMLDPNLLAVMAYHKKLAAQN